MTDRLPLDRTTPVDATSRRVVRDWVAAAVPGRLAGRGRRVAVPRSGRCAVAPTTRPGTPRSRRAGSWWRTWPVAYGGLDLTPAQARAAEAELAPYNLGRLNPLGLNSAAPALFAYGTEEQRLRYLPPIVANRERWCQLLSEPGAGSDLASLATRAVLDGEEWVLDGQKVWTTWAHVSDFAICLARTDAHVPKRQGLTYFLVDLHAPGVTVRPLAPPRRRDRLQRGLPRRRAGARRAAGGRAGRGLAGRGRDARG